MAEKGLSGNAYKKIQIAELKEKIQNQGNIIHDQSNKIRKLENDIEKLKHESNKKAFNRMVSEI